MHARAVAGLAGAMRCQCVLLSTARPGARIHIFGYASDLERVDILYTSLLLQMAHGLTNRQIGERLSVSVKTVKKYVSVLFLKLGMEQRTQAAAYAARVFDGRTPGLSQDMRIINRRPRDG